MTMSENFCDHCWHRKIKKHGNFADPFTEVSSTYEKFKALICCHCGKEKQDREYPFSMLKESGAK